MTLIQTIMQKELNNQKQIKFTLIHHHFQERKQYSIHFNKGFVYLFISKKKNLFCKHKIEIKIQQDIWKLFRKRVVYNASMRLYCTLFQFQSKNTL